MTDQRATKKRPAVAVSSGAYHRERPDLIILAVTSQVRVAPAIGEAAIAKWKEAGLLKPSVFKPLIATIEKGLVLHRLGRIGEDDQRTLRDVLRVIIG